jgi:hypothetical protein
MGRPVTPAVVAAGVVWLVPRREVEAGIQAGSREVPAQIGEDRAQRVTTGVGRSKQLHADTVCGDVRTHCNRAEIVRCHTNGESVFSLRSPDQREDRYRDLGSKRRRCGRRSRRRREWAGDRGNGCLNRNGQNRWGDGG